MATKTNDYIDVCARKNTSPSTQWTDCGLGVVKTYDNAESLTVRKENSWEATDYNTEGCNQGGTSAHSEQTLV